MRDAAAAILREVGVERAVRTCSSPLIGYWPHGRHRNESARFAQLRACQQSYRLPDREIAARLAVGMSLDEIPNDITKKRRPVRADDRLRRSPKFRNGSLRIPGADSTLGTQMKSVGEVMAIGRTFKESLQRRFARSSRTHPGALRQMHPIRSCAKKLATPRPDRIHWILTALERGLPAVEICDLTKIDPWFIQQIQELIAVNKRAAGVTVETASKELLREVKRHGTSDEQLAQMWKTTPAASVCSARDYGVSPVFKRVDTCAAEFESFTPYMYSYVRRGGRVRYSTAPENHDSRQRAGSHRQGIEFDYCCCHASFALREDGFETIMVNCNPETVSTDYDTSDRLYFRTAHARRRARHCRARKTSGRHCAIRRQTPLNLAMELKRNGVRLWARHPVD